MNKKGFTLVELMVVIVIIGILAAVAAPKLSDNINSARCNEVPKKFKEIMDKVVEAEASSGAYESIATAAIDSVLGIKTTSKYWQYSTTVNGTGDTLTITATVKTGVNIGSIAAADYVTVDNFGNKGDFTTDSSATKKYMKSYFAQ